MGAEEVTTVIGIDPGKHKSAMACFINGRFEWAEFVTVDSTYFDIADVVVAEHMQWYPGSPVRVEDLIDLNFVSGAVAGCVLRPGGFLVHPTAATWKGQTPKTIHNRRVLDAVGGLKATIMRHKKGDRDHLIDAAGLAWWYICGRKKL